jgi:hypothetical protein
METLFDDLEGFNNKEKLTLKIKSKDKKVLSKEQLLFNNLTSRIDNLKQTIQSDGEKMDRLLSFYLNETFPVIKVAAAVGFQLAKAVDDVSQKFKLTRNQIQNIAEIILFLCEAAGELISDEPGIDELTEKWADIANGRMTEDEFDLVQDLVNDFFNDLVGFEDDSDDFDENSDSFHGAKQSFGEYGTPNRGKKATQPRQKKKTDKQLAIEEARKAAENSKLKTLRQIYISLAKILHPDSELDPEMKSEKDELMKKVTIAYEEKDLMTLLRLELEWVHKNADSLSEVTSEKLMVYVYALQQQVKELERQKAAQQYQPRYHYIKPYLYLPEKQAILKIQQSKSKILNEVKDLKNKLLKVEKVSTKKEFLHWVNSGF